MGWQKSQTQLSDSTTKQHYYPTGHNLQATAPHFLNSIYFGVKSDHKKADSVGQSVWGSWIIIFTGRALLTWQLPQWRGFFFFPLIFIADEVISIIKDDCFTELCCFLPNINMNSLLPLQQRWGKEVFNHHTMFPP